MLMMLCGPLLGSHSVQIICLEGPTTLMGLPTEYCSLFISLLLLFIYIIIFSNIFFWGGSFTFSIYLDLTLELKVTFPTPFIKDKTKSTVGLHTVTGRQPAYAANKIKTLSVRNTTAPSKNTLTLNLQSSSAVRCSALGAAPL